MTSTSPRIRTFKDFWPYYLALHSKPGTRRFHMAGTLLALGLFLLLALAGRWTWLPIVLVVGYAPAWYSHFFIEHNRPATWRYPVWSFRADFKLLYLTLRGRLAL